MRLLTPLYKCWDQWGQKGRREGRMMLKGGEMAWEAKVRGHRVAVAQVYGRFVSFCCMWLSRGGEGCGNELDSVGLCKGCS